MINNNDMNSLTIINRHNIEEEISFDEIKNRIKKLIDFTKVDLIDEPLSHVNAINITMSTIAKLFDGITTRQLDTESARVCSSLESLHFNYGLLGGRILSSDLHKQLKIMNLNSYSKRVDYINEKLPKFYNKDFVNFIKSNSDEIDQIIDISRDYLINYFGFKTLERSYLIKIDKDTIETPQDMFMRVAINIHYRSNIDKDKIMDNIKRTYDLTSRCYCTHATPTLFNAGTNYEQMSSCYLLGTDDSLTGIFKTISDSAQISKWAGGIGIHISNIRPKGSKINSTNGTSDGIIPMIKVYNEVARYSNQCGKRKGSIALYLEPWHADIEGFLDLKKNTGAETERARDIFTALWIPDEFMRRIESNDDWYLMCPNNCPGLIDAYDKPNNLEFSDLYNKYVEEGNFIKKIKARELFSKIIESQIETGVPYICFKDNINRKSNQSNIGTIKSSNLCSEITEVSTKDEYAVCNLASIAVNKFIKNDKVFEEFWEDKHDINKLSYIDKLNILDKIKSIYDFDKLKKVAYQLTYNLNNIIDYNFYPTEETRRSNLKNRPIGIGVQGLGDLYYLMNVPYSSYIAKYIDSLVMETIYYGAVEASSDISKDKGAYSTFEGSPFSQGQLQFDLWKTEGKMKLDQYPQMYDWEPLKLKIKETGMANSLLTALMPTATTSQILGNNECFEPYSSNIYKRTTLAVEFQLINKHLVNKFVQMKIWDDKLRTSIITSDGSIQDIKLEDKYLKNVYKTIWEIKQKDIIDHALARGPYVDQSQSMNLFFASPKMDQLFSALVYGWKNGIKTGCYYLRSKPATEAIKYSIDASNKECTMCSS